MNFLILTLSIVQILAIQLVQSTNNRVLETIFCSQESCTFQFVMYFQNSTFNASSKAVFNTFFPLGSRTCNSSNPSLCVLLYQVDQKASNTRDVPAAWPAACRALLAGRALVADVAVNHDVALCLCVLVVLPPLVRLLASSRRRRRIRTHYHHLLAISAVSIAYSKRPHSPTLSTDLSVMPPLYKYLFLYPLNCLFRVYTLSLTLFQCLMFFFNLFYLLIGISISIVTFDVLKWLEFCAPHFVVYGCSSVF